MAVQAYLDAGDTWTWTAIDADSKLIVSWLVGGRDGQAADEFMMDLADRLTDRVQLTSDGLKVYEGAVEDTRSGPMSTMHSSSRCSATRRARRPRATAPASARVRSPERVQGEPNPDHIATSYVERHNLTMRMSMRRFTRLTNAFSKKLQNMIYALALYFLFYNFCRIHRTLRMSPAMAAGITDTLRDVEWIVGLIDARAPKPQKPGPKPGSKRGG